MLSNPDFILFAIQGSIRLANQIRAASVDKAKQQDLVLPLPDFPQELDWRKAMLYFEGEGIEYSEANPRVNFLTRKARNQDLTQAQKDELVDWYKAKQIKDQEQGGDFLGIPASEVLALTKIKQWQKGGHISGFQRIAGSLVEIGVDFFVQNPGGIVKDGAQNKALKSFLTGIEQVSFSDASFGDIAAGLMVSSLETVSKNPDIFTGDASSQELVTVVTKGLSQDIQNHITHLKQGGTTSFAKEEKVKAWGQAVFRSVLTHGGKTVLSDPSRFLGTSNKDSASMINQVGSAVLDVMVNKVVNDPVKGKVELGAFLSQEAINSMVKASFVAVAENPSFFKIKNKGIENILGQLFTDMSKYPNDIGLGMMPEVARLVLENTAENLDTVWPGDTDKAAQHLLLHASKTTLDLLAKPASGGNWKPLFNKTQTLALVDSMVKEVANHPEWITAKVQDKPMLHHALTGALEALQTIPASQLNKGGRLSVVQSAVKAVALRQELIEKKNIDGKEQYLISFAVGAITDLVFGNQASAKARWTLAKTEVYTQLVDVFLNRVTEGGTQPEKVKALKSAFAAEIAKLDTGGAFSMKQLENIQA